MSLRPLSCEYVTQDSEQRVADLQRQVAELERKLSDLTNAITVTPTGEIQIQTTTLTVEAAVVRMNSPLVENSGVVRCDSIIANSVIGSSYTPGAGNVM